MAAHQPHLLATAAFSLLLAAAAAAIDRQALVARHNVRAAKVDTAAPLTVGNGEFGFTADVTGLQTLNASYGNPPLQTMSHWGWHKVPAQLAGVDPSMYTYERVTVDGHAHAQSIVTIKDPVQSAEAFLNRLFEELDVGGCMNTIECACKERRERTFGP